MQQDYEKLGVFYLGRPYDLARSQALPGWTLYDSKDLVTHALCVGMTGSGKTGLCLSLLEEAAIDGIPALVIDPKGDLGNLLLTFPELKGSDFEPWVNAEEARTRALSVSEFAAQEAQRWKQGLAEWSQDGARIARMRGAAEITIYTPGSHAGVSVSLLKSFQAPPPALREAGEALRERVATTVASLLGLLGIEADPLQSREHILLSTLLERAWLAGEDLDLATLIARIQEPGVARVGVFELDAFYPAKERFALAMRINNLLASPSFAAWMEGEALDIGRALWTPEGKPRIAIFSIAHLSDAERMFFVSLLLGETLSWMRTQAGTSSLRAILYMDEIFGYFPPIANPPSKQPLLTLLKQARAYGLGVLLATQNPVDLDYKGLSNCGTWFLGRLQTERDKQRVLEGLEGAAAQSGSGFDRATMEATLSGLGKRVFLLNNVHQREPRVFQTRWTLSYLAGPLTRTQIQRLVPKTAASPAASPAAAKPAANNPAAQAPTPLRKLAAASPRPVLAPNLSQFFLPVLTQAPPSSTLSYLPGLYAKTDVWYEDKKLGLGELSSARVLLELDPDRPLIDWQQASPTSIDESALETEAQEPASFGELPPAALKERSYSSWRKELEALLYREARLKLFQQRQLQLTSQPGEDLRAFRIRVSQAAREARDAALEELRAKQAPKRAMLEERLRRAQQRVEKERAESSEAKLTGLFSIGASLLGAFTGRSSSAKLSRAASGARAASRVGKQGQDVEHANQTLETAQAALAHWEQEFQAAAAELALEYEKAVEAIEELSVAPKKANIQVKALCLTWMPYWSTPEGRVIPAWG